MAPEPALAAVSKDLAAVLILWQSCRRSAGPLRWPVCRPGQPSPASSSSRSL